MPIYRKGEGQMDDSGGHEGLKKAALDQRIAREQERRDIGDTAQDTRDWERGITTARFITDVRSTPLSEMGPKELGPVSGAELKKYAAQKSQKKRDKANNMKRR